MSFSNTAMRWGGVAKGFHWLMAVMIVLAIVLGVVAEEMPLSPAKLKVFILHKSVGISILALVILRIVWRVTQKAPGAPTGISALNKKLANLGHFALYGLMLLLPVSGWILNSAADFPFRWFGLFAVPSITSPNEELHELSESIHVFAAWVLLVVFLGHAVMAIKHHRHGSDVLLRMAPASLPGRALAGVLFVAVIPIAWFAANSGTTREAAQPAQEQSATQTVSQTVSESTGNLTQVWIQQPKSRLTFVATYDAVGFNGEFKSFVSRIYFDPDDLTHSVIEADVTVASVDTQSSERDEMLPDSDWFNAKVFPVSQYRATTIRQLDDARYLAEGILSLKGTEKPVVLTFSWTETDNNHVAFKGSAEVDRRDFGIGSGMWADDATVGFAVEINVDLLLKKAE